MKGTELMIGDWVDEKLTFYDGKFVGKHQWQLYDFKEYDDDWEKWISPIPLTTEILEKNGFKDYTEIFEYQFKEGEEKYRFYLKKMYDKNNEVSWGTNIGGVLPSLITYVHELQHALRLCGLNELADNFKV